MHINCELKFLVYSKYSINVTIIMIITITAIA